MTIEARIQLFFSQKQANFMWISIKMTGNVSSKFMQRQTCSNFKEGSWFINVEMIH